MPADVSFIVALLPFAGRLHCLLMLRREAGRGAALKQPHRGTFSRGSEFLGRATARHWRCFMNAPMNTAVVAQEANTGVAWDAVAAGAVAAAAFTVLLVALGAGLGFSAISPWSDSGLSAGGFRTATGIYLVLISIMASAIGGYMAARLRTR